MQGQQQVHHRVVHQLEENRPRPVVFAHPAHDGDQPGAVHGFQRGLEFLGDGPSFGV